MPAKTLIFDFDGTLADSFELVLDIAHELTGMPRLSDREVDQLRQLPLLKVTRQLKIPLSRVPGMVLKGRQIMHERLHEVHPFPGIPEVLRTLHEEGYHMLVTSSNSEQNVRAFLRANDMESYFDGVYGSASVISKAGTLRRVLKRNRLDAAHCFYIGDEVRDVVAAIKVGIAPIAVTWGYQAAEALASHQPFALIKEPADLPGVVSDQD